MDKLFSDLQKLETFKDGREDLFNLYQAHLKLVTNYGWRKEIIYKITLQTITKQKVTIPVFCFLSPKVGKSLWLLTGIHGEEPAGPNAIVNKIDYIGKFGQKIPFVLMPMLNPSGYYRNWRFHNKKFSLDRLNVTDCRHLIPTFDSPQKPLLNNVIHPIADKFTKFVINLLDSYPPILFIDLHEDEKLSDGYIYSQGELAEKDPVAKFMIRLLKNSNVSLQTKGRTRFPHELIKNGVVVDDKGNRVKDGSIDQFIVEKQYFNKKGFKISKPFAATSIVIETPTKGHLSLTNRIKAHEKIISNLEIIYKLNN